MRLLLVLLTLSACGTRPPPAEVVPSWAKVTPNRSQRRKTPAYQSPSRNDLGMRFVLIPAGTCAMGSKAVYEPPATRPSTTRGHQVTSPQAVLLQIDRGHLRTTRRIGANDRGGSAPSPPSGLRSHLQRGSRVWPGVVDAVRRKDLPTAY